MDFFDVLKYFKNLLYKKFKDKIKFYIRKKIYALQEQLFKQ